MLDFKKLLSVYVLVVLSFKAYTQKLVAKAEVKMNNWVLINEKGEQISHDIFGHMGGFGDGYYIVRDGNAGGWGYINSMGRLVVQTKYGNVKPFSCGIAAVQSYDRTFKYINKIGTTVAAGPFGDVRQCVDSVFFARMNEEDEFRLYNFKGKEIDASNTYDVVATFNNGFSAVKAMTKEWQIINTQGMVLFRDKEMSYIKNSSSGMFPFRKSGKWGFIDSTFKIAIPAIYDSYQSFSGPYARVEKGNKVIIIDKVGNELSWSKNFKNIGDYSEGLFPVKINFLWGFANEKGELIIPYRYLSVNSFNEGLSLVKENSLVSSWGYINTSGEWVISPQYAGGKDCKNGFVFVKSAYDGEWFFISKAGKIIPGKFNAGDFFEKVEE